MGGDVTIDRDIAGLGASHRSGSREVTATIAQALDHAHRSQKDLNAFALIDDAGATAAARKIADDLDAGVDPGPLAGVPITVKDILDVAGLPTCWGSPLTADAAPAKADIAVVARLRAAGAVIVAKTTTTEFAHSPLGTSPLTGVTRNPWAPDLTCGGSSAGAGVSVAAGIAPLALATDAGCSARLPAACTGVFGFKPTLGRMPHDRVPEAFGNFIHLGLLAASVRDLATGLGVAAGPHPLDPHSQHAPLELAFPAEALAGKRVVLWMTAGNARVAEEVVDATRRVARLLEQLGAEVVEQPYPLENPDPIWRSLQQANWAVRFSSFSEADRARLSPALQAGIAEALAGSTLDLQRALVKRTALHRQIQGMLETADFILTPSVSAPAISAEHDLSMPLVIDGVEVGDIRTEWTPALSLFDLSGHPALSMPAGFAANGGPLGVQLVGRWAGEAALLAAAAAYETVSPAPRWKATEPVEAMA